MIRFVRPSRFGCFLFTVMSCFATAGHADAEERVRLFLEEPQVFGGLDVSAVTRVDVHVRGGNGASLGPAVGGVELERVGTPGGTYGLWLSATPEQAELLGLIEPNELFVVPLRPDDPAGTPSPRVLAGFEARRTAYGRFALFAENAATAGAALRAAATGRPGDDPDPDDRFEVTPTHLHDRDAGGEAWDLMTRLASANPGGVRNAQRNLSLLRLFLEAPDAEPEGRILAAVGGQNVEMRVPQAKDSQTPYGNLASIHDGYFVGVWPSASPDEIGEETTTRRFVSVRHLPADVTVPVKPEGIVPYGDVLLRRPPEVDRCDLEVHVTMLSGRLVGAFEFRYGPKPSNFFGEPLGRDGTVTLRGLTPQTLRVGLSIRRNKEEQYDVDLAAGTVTTLRFLVDDMGEVYFVSRPTVATRPRGEGDD